jgi:lysozyme
MLRPLVATVHLDSAGLTLVKQSEGCRLEAYPDDAGVWTIGYGHTDDVTEGITITQAQADQFLADDAGHAVSIVTAVAGATSATYQFDAMVSLAFNIGSNAFRSSTILRQHRAGNYLAAGNAFLTNVA